MITNTIKLYEDRDDVTLTSYVLADSPDLLNGKKRPGVLICPGGAYLFCSDREAEPIALRFAAMGYHAFVLRYSTYNSGSSDVPMPDSNHEGNKNSIHPGPVRDIGKAFLTLHTHADEWLLDMDKIAICGFSAGGHNCAMYSVYWDKPVITEFFGEDPALFRPAASILCYAVCHYLITFDMPDIVMDANAEEISLAANIAFMGTASPSRELLEEISPTVHVSKNTPPTFLWATAADGLVPVENSTRMATALAHAGVPFEIHVFEEGAHGLGLADQTTAGSLQQLDGDAEKWMGLADAWLKKRFALPLPPQPNQ